MKFKLTIEGTEEEIERAKDFEDFLLGFNDRTYRYCSPPDTRDHLRGISEVTYQVKQKQYRVKTLKELVMEFGDKVQIGYDPLSRESAVTVNGLTCITSILGEPRPKLQDNKWYETFLKEE